MQNLAWIKANTIITEYTRITKMYNSTIKVGKQFMAFYGYNVGK